MALYLEFLFKVNTQENLEFFFASSQLAKFFQKEPIYTDNLWNLPEFCPNHLMSLGWNHGLQIQSLKSLMDGAMMS